MPDSGRSIWEQLYECDPRFMLQTIGNPIPMSRDPDHNQEQYALLQAQAAERAQRFISRQDADRAFFHSILETREPPRPEMDRTAVIHGHLNRRLSSISYAVSIGADVGILTEDGEPYLVIKLPEGYSFSSTEDVRTTQTTLDQVTVVYRNGNGRVI